MTSVADIIAQNRPSGSIEKYAGQVLTFVSIEEADSAYKQVSLLIKAVDSEGNDVELKTSSEGVVSVLQGIDAAGLFPVDLLVTSGPSSYPGKNWYGLEEA